MTDEEIEEYLFQHKYEVYGQDFIMDVRNKTYNITNEYLDYESMLMTVDTSTGGHFQFKWLLHYL